MRKLACCVFVMCLMAGCFEKHTGITLPDKSSNYVKGVEPEMGTPQYRALAHTRLAAAYLSHGQYGIALQELTKALEADSTYAHAYGLLGIIHAKLGDNDKADTAFTKAMSIAPKDPELMNNYSWFLCRSNRPSDGLQYALEAVKNPLYSTPEKAFVNAGYCYEKLHKIQEAINYYEKAIGVQKNNPLALYSLARVAATYNHYSQAKYYLDKLIDLHYKTPEVVGLMAEVEKHLEKHRDDQ